MLLFIVGKMGLWGLWILLVLGCQDVFSRVFVDYFKKLFSSMGSLLEDDVLFGIQGHVTPTMNAMLCWPFIVEEIKASLFHMPPTKVPGCYGMAAIFFQQYWNILGDSVIYVCLGVLNNKGDVSALNHTLIVLVPKV